MQVAFSTPPRGSKRQYLMPYCIILSSSARFARTELFPNYFKDAHQHNHSNLQAHLLHCSSDVICVADSAKKGCELLVLFLVASSLPLSPHGAWLLGVFKMAPVSVPGDQI